MATDASQNSSQHRIHSYTAHTGGASLARPYTSNEPGKATDARVEPPDEPPDSPPNGGYGWVCVMCCFLINAHTWGVNSSYGIFLAHYLQHNTFPGATSLHYAFVGGLSISMALILSPVATVCVGKFGTQFTLGIGIFLEFVGLLGASWATEIWHLFLTQGVAFGFGMGFLFVASVGVVPQWFSTRRSFANSIATAGSGVGGLVYSLSTNAMIQSIGLAWAFRVLAIIACFTNTFCTILVRDRNKAVGSVHMAFDFRLFKRPEFLLLLGWGFFSMLGYIVLLFSLPNYGRTIGLSAAESAVIGALLNLGQGIGRPLVGYFSDAAGRINMAGTCTFLAGLFCLLIWIFAKNYGVLIFFSLLVGTMSGTFWATIGPVGAEVVGLQVLPSALSIVWLVLVLPCTFAEPMGLELRASSGNIYLHAQIFTGLMYIIAALCLWFLRAWKIRDMATTDLTSEKRGAAIHDNGVVQQEGEGSRRETKAESESRVIQGLWSWQRV